MVRCVKYYDGGGEVLWEYTKGTGIPNLGVRVDEEILRYLI